MPSYTSGSLAVGYPVSGDYRIAALQGDPKHQVWSPLNLTYSFPSGPAYFDGGTNYGKGEVKAGWFPLNNEQKTAVKKALAVWSSVCGVTFTEVADGLEVGDLRFAFSWAVSGSTAGWAYFPESYSAIAGDVWLNASKAGEVWGVNSAHPENFQTLLHEVGHALGLSHSFAKTGETRGTAPLPNAEDNMLHTIMSYNQAYTPTGGYPITLMPYDILAAQYLYIPNYFYNSGNDVYKFNIDSVQVLTIYDAGGIDTIVAESSVNTNQRSGAKIDLNPGAPDYSYGGSAIGYASQYDRDWAYANLPVNLRGNAQKPNIAIAFDTIIENAVGTRYGDWLIGNSANNMLTGGGTVSDGIDNLDGRAGIDTAVFSGKFADYKITPSLVNAQYSVQGPLDRALLLNIERLKFSDVSVAIDLAGNAGKAAKLLGAVFGKAEVANKAYVGIGLQLLDGGMSYEALTALALGAAGASTPQQIVNLLWTNVIGSAPTAQQAQPFVDMLNGDMTAGQLGVLAADTTFNTGNINLVGLTNTGIEYV